MQFINPAIQQRDDTMPRLPLIVAATMVLTLPVHAADPEPPAIVMVPRLSMDLAMKLGKVAIDAIRPDLDALTAYGCPAYSAGPSDPPYLIPQGQRGIFPDIQEIGLVLVQPMAYCSRQQ